MHRTATSNKPILASIAAWFFVSILSGCNGAGPYIASPGSSPGLPSLPAHGSSRSAATSPYSFQTVDNPNSDVNEVTAINQRAKIVGFYDVGSGSNIPSSYTAEPPYTKFRDQNYPGAQGTVATSLSTTRIVGGYAIDPNGLGGIWGFLQIRGLSTLLYDPSEGTGSYAITEILGLNDKGSAVGFYVNYDGVDVPFELDIAQGSFSDLTPAGAESAQATGINNKGNVTGIETLPSGIVGFYMQSGTYYKVVHPSSKQTEALGLNEANQVVGSYVTTDGKTHGFILTGPTNGGDKQVWETIDDPEAHDMTVVTGINDHGAICGWYDDASEGIHGFVGTPN